MKVRRISFRRRTVVKRSILIILVVLMPSAISTIQSVSVADEIPGNDIPKVEYHIDTGLVLLDPDGLALATVTVDFSDQFTNTFFDNSPDNPLFAEFGGLIPNWESYDVGEGIGGESTVAQGYSGPMRAWAQISNGLSTSSFLNVGYGWVENPYPGDVTNVTVVPEPTTVLLLGLGGLALLRKRRT